VRCANIRTSGLTPARSAAASFLRRPGWRMRSVRLNTGDMSGFIHVQTKLIQFMDTEDKQLQELTTEELGYTDILVNTDHINYIFDDKMDTIIMMKNGSTLYIKETIHEVHQRIKRSTALFIGQ
jgi:uncharacterized protein YlzI (FlbEa/FlbD family)